MMSNISKLSGFVDLRTIDNTDFAAAHCICGVLFKLDLIDSMHYIILCKHIAESKGNSHGGRLE